MSHLKLLLPFAVLLPAQPAMAQPVAQDLTDELHTVMTFLANFAEEDSNIAISEIKFVRDADSDPSNVAEFQDYVSGCHVNRVAATPYSARQPISVRWICRPSYDTGSGKPSPYKYARLVVSENTVRQIHFGEQPGMRMGTIN